MIDSVLLGYQQRWIADRARVRVCEKSRRIGLSWAMAAEAALVAGAAERAQDVWYISYNKEMCQGFIGDVGRWAQAYSMVASEVAEELLTDEDGKEITMFSVSFASGRRVAALSSRPRSLRSRGGLVVIDEAAFVDDLAELLKAALAFLVWGGRVAIISTHDGVENAFNELVENVRAGRKPYSLHRITLDDALADGLYRRICEIEQKSWSAEAQTTWRQELIDSYDNADEELFCIPRRSGGAYLPLGLIEERMDAVECPSVRLSLDDAFAQLGDGRRSADVLGWCEAQLAPLLAQLPTDQQHALGQDFARSGHLSVLAPLAIGPRMIRRVPWFIELQNVPFREQEIIFNYVADRLPRFLAAALDATGNGAYLAERAAQRYGAMRVSQVNFHDAWYADHVPRFRAALEDGLLRLPRSVDLRDDLRAFRIVRGIPKMPRDAERSAGRGKRHGDAAIAVLLAWVASKIDVEEFGYEPVKAPVGDEHRAVRITANFRGTM